MPPSSADGDEGRLDNTSFVGSVAGVVGSMRAPPDSEDMSTAAIIKEVLVHGTPLGLAAVAQLIIGTILVAMVGRMVGVVQLGAASLSFGLINATVFSFASGFSGALETVLSYSYGRDPTSKLYGVYAQRMALLLLFVSASLGPILIFADSLLTAIGMNPEVVYYTGIFCRIALFGAYPVNLLEILRRYYACQNLSTPLSVNLIIGAVVFPFLLWPLIKVFGFAGAPIGWVMLMVTMPASLLVYLIRSGQYKKTWGGWDSTALQNWGPLMKLAIPSMAMMLSEWVSLEINAITAGYAPAEDLAAFSIIYQTSSIFWSFASGSFIEAAVLVGSALGKRKPSLARRSAYCCVVMATIQGVLNICLLFLVRGYLPYLFTDDEKVVAIFKDLFPFFALYHIFDCTQSAMMGVLRGCGMQVVGAVAVALVYSVVGVPLGITLFVTTDLSVRALWLGPGLGVSCIGFPLYMYLLFRHIKWDELDKGGEDSLSLNSSMDLRSMASRAPSTPSLDDLGDDRGFGTGTPRGSFGRRQHTHSGPHTPGSGSAPATMNTSFASHFHIPGRNILITPTMNTQHTAPRDRSPNMASAGGGDPFDQSTSSAERDSRPLWNGLPPSHCRSASVQGEDANDGDSHDDIEHSTASLRQPPSSTDHSPTDTGAHARLFTQERSHTPSSASSSRAGVGRPPEHPETPRPASPPSSD